MQYPVRTNTLFRSDKNIKREALKKTIESVSMLMPPLDPNPPTVSALGYNVIFIRNIFWICGVVWYAVK